jgi:uncharacterized protein YdeI (YjbR/CyaY-like superfamily)
VAIDLPELLVPNASAWRDWLMQNFDASDGVWLVLHKKGGTLTELDYEQALEQALCFGWIDGQVSRRDEQSYRQRFTPRRPRSMWSATNVARVARLIADGQMMPAGHAAIDAAKADGRWDRAYAGSAASEVPADLADAIATMPAAQATFDALSRTNRYAVIWRVNEAKRSDTRARRIEQFVAMLARGEAPHPQKALRTRSSGDLR